MKKKWMLWIIVTMLILSACDKVSLINDQYLVSGIVKDFDKEGGTAFTEYYVDFYVILENGERVMVPRNIYWDLVVGDGVTFICVDENIVCDLIIFEKNNIAW